MIRWSGGLQEGTSAGTGLVTIDVAHRVKRQKCQQAVAQGCGYEVFFWYVVLHLHCTFNNYLFIYIVKQTRKQSGQVWKKQLLAMTRNLLLICYRLLIVFEQSLDFFVVAMVTSWYGELIPRLSFHSGTESTSKPAISCATFHNRRDVTFVGDQGVTPLTNDVPNKQSPSFHNS